MDIRLRHARIVGSIPNELKAKAARRLKKGQQQTKQGRTTTRLTKEQDEQIIAFHEGNSEFKTERELAKALGCKLRTIKERWKNWLSCPKKTFTSEERTQIIKLVEVYGHQWTKISSFFQGSSWRIIRDEYQRLQRKCCSSPGNEVVERERSGVFQPQEDMLEFDFPDDYLDWELNL